MKKFNSESEIKSALYDYLIKDETLFNDCCDSLGVKSVVSEDPQFLPVGQKPKAYNFIGFGCGITWLDFPKRSNIAKMFDNCYRDVYMDVLKYLVGKFSKEDIEYYKSIGCPLTAVFYQDQHIQIEIYYRMSKFAKDILGFKKCEVESRLD